MHFSAFFTLIFLPFAAFLAHITLAAPVLPRILSHQQQVSLFTQTYRPIIKHKYPSDSGQKDHKDDHDDQEYYCRNEPEYNYDDLKACNMAAPLDTDMGDITTSATPIVFEARVDSDHYHQLIRSINGISDIVLMPIPFPDNHHSSKKTQPWYRRWLSLWSKARSVKNDVDDIDWDGPQFILSQPMSMLPIDNESETDNDQSKNILLTLTPFSQLDRYSPKYQYNDYDQIKKRSIEKDAVMQVIASDVVF